MTTEQIIRIVLKRVDSVVKSNYYYLNEIYEIRKDIYTLLNDPIIKSEILNLKKEAMFKKKTDEIERLIEDRKKEREVLFERIAEARREYENVNTTERTVQLDLNNLNIPYENETEADEIIETDFPSTLDPEGKEVFNTSELEGFLDEKARNEQQSISEKIENSAYAIILAEIENKKKELEKLQREMLVSANPNESLKKIGTLTWELRMLYTKLVKKPTDIDIEDEEIESTSEQEMQQTQKRQQQRWGVKYHDNMSKNPEIAEMKRSYQNLKDLPRLEELQKKNQGYKENEQKLINSNNEQEYSTYEQRGISILNKILEANEKLSKTLDESEKRRRTEEFSNPYSENKIIKDAQAELLNDEKLEKIKENIIQEDITKISKVEETSDVLIEGENIQEDSPTDEIDKIIDNPAEKTTSDEIINEDPTEEEAIEEIVNEDPTEEEAIEEFTEEYSTKEISEIIDTSNEEIIEENKNIDYQEKNDEIPPKREEWKALNENVDNHDILRKRLNEIEERKEKQVFRQESGIREDNPEEDLAPIDVNDEIPSADSPAVSQFEREIFSMSKNLKYGLLKMSFTRDQYDKLIRKFPSLARINVEKKKDKIKFEFDKRHKKLLKK